MEESCVLYVGMYVCIYTHIGKREKRGSWKSSGSNRRILRYLFK
jgi:hypothetical protein